MSRFCARTIFALAFGLTLLGILTLSHVGKIEAADHPYHYVIMQSAFFVAGLCMMTLFYRLDYRLYLNKTFLWCLAIGMFLALLLIFVPGIGKTIAGSRRWIGLGPINVQPAEFVKLGAIIFISGYFGRIGPLVQRWELGFIIPLAYIGILLGLVLCQPDFGSTLILCGLCGLTLLTSGARFRRIAIPALLALVVVAALLLTNDNRRARLINEQEGENYQAKQSEIAFQNGGAWGVGLGRGIQKEHYLPECHTDFILAVIAEDLGLVATASVATAYFLILLCGCAIALRAPDRQGMALAIGAVTLICAQAFANIAVVTHIFPTKGLALPFLSYGGSSLLSSYAAIGVLLGVARTTSAAEDLPPPPGGRLISLT